MSKLNVIVVIAVFLFAIFFSLSSDEEVYEDCMDIKYSPYKTLHFVPISEGELYDYSEYEFKESNRFFYDLYWEIEEKSEKIIAGDPIDFRIAFKACDTERWMFYALNSYIKLGNLVYDLDKKKVNSIVSEMNLWDERFKDN
jgi:hypothetical protein